jgi:hypothetical protein
MKREKHDLPFFFQLTWTHSCFQNWSPMRSFISYHILIILKVFWIFIVFFWKLCFLNSSFLVLRTQLERSERQCYNYCLFLATMATLDLYTFWRLRRNIWLLFEPKALITEYSSFSAELSKQSKIVTSRLFKFWFWNLKITLKLCHQTKSG